MIRSVTDVATPPTLDALLRLILTSRVYDVARETPLDRAPRLSDRLGAAVHFKREDLPTRLQLQLRRPTTRSRN